MNASPSSEAEPLVSGVWKEKNIQEDGDDSIETRVYHRRFYVVLVVFFMAFTQSWIWNGWGPIQGPAEAVFGWSDATIALMANWGPISYVISTFFFAWLMGKSIRTSVVLTSFLVAAGAGLRVLSMEPTAATWLNHVGLFLNGLGGPVAMSVAPLISAYWFPPKQRTTATALTSLAGYYGVSFSFVIGPLLVPDRNVTNISSISSDIWKNCNLTIKNSTDCQIEMWTHDIKMYQLIQFIAAGVVFLAALLYFPSKPPKPPSITAAIERINYVDGVKKLLRHKQFWLACLAYGISTGVFGAWSSVLDVNLKHFGIGETEAGWLGFYANVAGAIAGVVVSGLADYIGRKTKTILMIMLIAATASFTWFTLLCMDVLPKSTVSLYVSSTLGGMLINGSIPLFYELAVERTYPIAEGTTAGVLTMMNNTAALIFLLLPMIKVLERDVRYWMNPTIAGACFICIPLMVLFKARYKRLSVDLSSEKQEKEN